MQQSFSPDRLVTKAESAYLKRTPLAVISYANNEKASASKTGESTILCKRIDNSAHFVDISQQAQPARKFTPLAIPLEVMKRKNVQQTNALHARVSVTEPAEYVHHTPGLETQPLHTETSESGRNTKYKNIPKERVSASVKSRSKAKQKDSFEKKGSESKLAGSKPRAQIKDMLKGSHKVEKKTGEDVKPVKRISPRKTANVTTTIHRENIPPPYPGASQKAAQKAVKHSQENKAQFQTQLKKASVERKSVKSNYGAKASEAKSHEKTMERSPLRETTELDKFVKYNAMKIMEKMKEQKLQDEFERRLNEERKIALDEGNRRIREANFVRFNASVKPRIQNKTKLAWGADQRKFERQPRSSSSQKRARPNRIEDEDRRKILGLDHLDEEQILRLRQKALASVQDVLDRSAESKPKRVLNEEEHENIQRYMLEKRYRMEEEMRSKQQEEYEDYMKKRKNLEILFTEIRESRELLPRPKSTKKKGKKRTKKRKTHKEDEGGLRIYQAFTEPNDQRHKAQHEEDDENYSLLYNQYKEIIKAKTSPKEERASSNERRTTGKKKRTISPKPQAEKKGYKEKQEELSNRIQKQLAGQTVSGKSSKKGEGRGSHKGRQVFENERNEAQKIIMEMDTDNFSDNDYIRSESMVINSEDRYPRGVEGESDESQGQDIPDNSAREIIEAAAIFIQKNYRGYRTRKILTEYINQLNQLYQEELELEEHYQEDSRGQIVHRGGGGGEEEYYEGEEEEDREDEEEDPRRYLQQQGLFGAQGHHHQKKKYEDDDEEDYAKEGQGEIHGEEFVGDDEKQSLRSLLEKQKLELHDEYQDDSIQQEEDEEKSEEVDAGAHHKYKGMAEPQYNMFYGHEDIQYDENGQVIKTEDYSNLDQDQIVEDEYVEYDKDAAYYAVPSPRRARSDGEILDLLEFDMDQEEEEEEDDEDNQISLHNDGEDDYEMLVHNKRYMVEKGGMQDKYFEELIREKQRDSRSNRQQDSQGNEYQEEYGEEYQEGQHQGFDPRIQKGYLQGYSDDYGDQDEEGYIHESNYDVEYAPEDEAALYQHGKQGKARHSEGDIRHGGHYDQEESSQRIENAGTPDEEESDHDHEERQQGEGPDNEKMVMISTINSEDGDEGNHYPEAAGHHQFRNYPQRRIKSDIINRKPEPESYTQSQRDTEERKSQVTSQRESQAGRLSQKDQVSSRYQVDGGSQDAIEGEYGSHHEEHVSVDMLDPNDKLENTDSEHFREELIQELSHYNENDKSDHQDHGEERKTEKEEKVEQVKVEESATPPRPSYKDKVHPVQTSAGLERPSVQRSTESTELYQAELNRLKEEQAMKWEQMMTHLSLLTSQDELHLNKDLKAFIETLQKQSEINKRQLTDDIDTQSLVEAQASVGERHSATQGEANFFNITQPSHLQKPLPQSAQNTIHMIASNMPPASKKLEMVSPLQESKYGKKKKPFGFAKKTNLQIDINAANEENNNEAASAEQGPLNLDLSQMRLVLGSEQLLREQSARTLSHSLSVPSDVESVDLQGQENPEGTSIFERDPFKEFTRRKFKELLQQENMKNLIKMREQALEIRHKTHLDHMTKMLETRRVSPRTFQNKKIELEKWINKEREIIQKTKRDIEKGWLSTADSIQRTQRDLMFLQKLGATADGRNTNTSGDISLRHSFTDEDNFENVESQSERLSKRSLFGIAAELKTPSSSKNIKIIDKFELKDNLFSPQISGTGLIRGDIETKEAEDRIKHTGEVPGSGLKVKETEESDKHEHGIIAKGSLPASEKKAELQAEEQIEKKEQHKKESPRKIDEDEQVELQPEEMGDEEIEWENEALQSPLAPENRAENYTPGKSTFSSRKEAVSPPGLGEVMPSTSSNYSPKSQEDLRFMIQEKLSNIKPPIQEEHAPVVEEPIKEVAEEQVVDQHVLENIQAKTDLICKDILEDLFFEMGEEFAAEGKEHIWNKVAMIGEEPPVQTNLQNMIENNYFFHGGAEHVNFQANIPMPLSPTSEYFRLQQEKNSSSLELTPEQQMEKHYQDAQSELLKTLGIKTEVAAVTKYLDMVIEEIKGSYKENFLRNINTPLGFSTSEKLNNMRNYDLGASDSSSLAMSSSDSQLVLEIHVYFKIEERIMEEDPNKNEVSTELEHIHNKMIFDCINEILDAYRPFGLNGQPFPWKVGSKILKCQEINEENTNSILEKMKMKIIDWASYLCGYYGEGDEFVIDKTQSFIDEYLAQVREERILRMLSEEIFELENKWITYDDEEAEVELEIADLVFDKMVTEAAELLAQMYEKKQPSPPESKGNESAGANPNARKMNQRPGFSDITKIETDLNFNSV